MVKYGVCLTLLLLSIVVYDDCRPTIDDDEGDFHIDDSPLGQDESGSGIDEESLPETSTKALTKVGSRDDDEEGSGSGVDDQQDDLSFSGDELTTGSASGDQDADIKVDGSETRSTTKLTTIRKDNNQDVDIKVEGSETRSTTKLTTIRKDNDQDADIKVEGSETRSTTKLTTIRKDNISSTTTVHPTTTQSEVFRPDVDHGSGFEEDPEFELMTDSPGDFVSGSGGGVFDDDVTEDLASTHPPKAANTSKTPTLPSDIVIKEDLIPVTDPQTSRHHHHHHKTSPSVVESVPTTTPTSYPEEATLSTDKVTTIVKSIGETTVLVSSSSSSSSRGIMVQEQTTQISNHSKGGRRRHPIHTDTTPAVHYEEVSAGASEKEKDDDKKVSYFAVIAAAIISAIVFFLLGYLARKLKDRRGKIPMPWKKGQLKIEENDDAGSSSAQAYHDKKSDRPTSLHVDTEAGNSKPTINGSKDVESTKNMAEIHPNPAVLAGETGLLATAVPSAPETPDTVDERNPASSSKASLDAMKYMDETDDELEQPAASTPLLPDDSKGDADRVDSDRGDLATQVLNTVDKNLNADSETTGLLAENSVKESGSNATTSSGDILPV